MTFLRTVPILAVLAVVAIVGASAGSDDDLPIERVRGMTISCHTWGWEWGTDDMVRTMERLRDLGVNWISIHPYGGIDKEGNVRLGRVDSENPPEWLTRPIAEAHRLGMKIMIKPHLAYWGSGFSWRGEIRFDTDEKWERFFTSYEKWILALAEICADTDAFAVGTELDGTLHHDREWRRIIGGVRERTDAALTYAANWDTYTRVGFWDELDTIGIQAYFPLANHEKMPTGMELDGNWQRVLSRLTTFSEKQNKKIVFGELGYNRSSAAAIRPWESKSGGPQADEVQRRCMESALRAIAHSDVVVGAFLWKWFPGESSRSNFLMSSESMQRVIRDQWGQFAPPDTSEGE